MCVTMYWLFWKCFLTINPSSVNKYDAKRLIQNRIGIVARAVIELGLSLILTTSYYDGTPYPFLYCLTVFSFVAIRSVFSEYVDLTASIFVFVYFAQNCLVNIIDFAYYKHFLGFYHDDLFLRMFSYKVF